VDKTTVVKALATEAGMGASDVASETYRICATTCPAIPDFGPNVHIFDPSMSSTAIQNKLDSQFAELKDTQTAQFSDQRVADLYMPGTYSVHDDVPYYTSVAGL